MIQSFNLLIFSVVAVVAMLELHWILTLHAGYASRSGRKIDAIPLPAVDAATLKRVGSRSTNVITRWDETSECLVFQRQFGPQNRYWGYAVGTVRPGDPGAVLHWHPGFAFPSWLLAGGGLGGALGLVFVEGEAMGWLVLPGVLVGVVGYRFFQQVNARHLMVQVVVPELAQLIREAHQSRDGHRSRPG